MPLQVGENITLYDLQELSRFLKVTTITLRAYLRTGRLRGQKIGRKWYVSEGNLRAFVEGETGEPFKERQLEMWKP